MRLETDARMRRDLLAADFAHSVRVRARRCARGCSRAAAERCACSRRSPATAAASPSCSTAPPRPASPRYLEGLDHRYHAQGLRVLTVKPGFVHTSMTDELDPPPFVGLSGRNRAPRRASARSLAARRLRARYLAGRDVRGARPAASRDAARAF